jgi:hypothetical protein
MNILVAGACVQSQSGYELLWMIMSAVTSASVFPLTINLCSNERVDCLHGMAVSQRIL